MNTLVIRSGGPHPEKFLGGGRLLSFAPCLGLMHTVSMLPGGPPPPGFFRAALAAPSLPASRGTPETEALLNRLLSFGGQPKMTPTTTSSRGNFSDQATLDRLDEPKERNQRSPMDLRLARIFERLRGNGSPPRSRHAWRASPRSDALNADWRLQELVIRAFEQQRPLRPESVAFSRYREPVQEAQSTSGHSRAD